MARAEISDARVVLFASAFRSAEALNITHVTIDGVKTLCGRASWATDEGQVRDVAAYMPDCLRCARAWSVKRIAAMEHTSTAR